MPPVGVPVINLLVELGAGELDLFGVDNDHEVAGIEVRRVVRFVLAAQKTCDLGRETA